MHFLRLRCLGLALLGLATASAPALAAPAAPSPASPASAPVAKPDMLRMTQMLDELDRQELEEVLEKTKRCTRARDFDCADKWLVRAGKLAHQSIDRQAIAYARQDLAEERALLAREQEIARQQREEEERLRKEEEARERRERQRKAEEREARLEANRERNRQELYQTINSQFQGVAKIYAETGNEVRQIEQKVAQINRERQAEANRESRRRQEAYDAEVRQRREAAAARQLALSRERESLDTERRRRDERAGEERRREESSRAAAAAEEERSAAARERQRLIREEKVAQIIANREAEDERKRKEAEAAAAKRAAVEEEARLKAEYLQALAAGTRLEAKQCMGVKDRYYVFGLLPKITPKRVECVDVHFSATCPGSQIRHSGIGEVFLGMSTGCMSGDIAIIQPVPECAAEDLRVRVDAIRPCE